jgi:DNA-binding IclR family transcriptional regulator
LDAATSDKETSLGKALRVLSAVGECSDAAGITVAELVKITGLSRPTTYRFLAELQEHGLVRSVGKQAGWQVGPRVVALAAMSGSGAMLRRRARQAMEEFVQTVGYTVHLGIRDGFDVVYVDKAENPDFMSISSVIGQKRPLSLTALGKCLVAFDADAKLVEKVIEHGLPSRTQHSITNPAAWRESIDKVRATAVAYDMEECEIGARCVAAPLRDAQGYAVAAISISMLVRQADEMDFERMTREIQRLAKEISAYG